MGLLSTIKSSVASVSKDAGQAATDGAIDTALDPATLNTAMDRISATLWSKFHAYIIGALCCTGVGILLLIVMTVSNFAAMGKIGRLANDVKKLAGRSSS